MYELVSTLTPKCTGRCVFTGDGFISATIPNVRPAGRYQVVVRLPGSTPTSLSAYPRMDTLGQLDGSPVDFTFDPVECAASDQVPSTDGSVCVCGPGYTRSEPAEAGSDVTTCEPCPQGFYKDDIEAISCQECDVTKFTLRAGSAHASDCVCKAGCVPPGAR